MTAAVQQKFRFSGHQSFPLRIAWLPKAAGEIMEQRDPFSNPDDGIQNLGLGKNMVESLRCWVDAFQIARFDGKRWDMSPIGIALFAKEGLDPYLDDPATPWVLHWLISTNRKSPFWAWECIFNRWPKHDFTASEVLDAFKRASEQQPKPVSPATLKQHWEVFLHTYRPPKFEKGEDNLDSALSLLKLIVPIGERPSASGHWEQVYAFDSAPKRGISQQLFSWFLHDWWQKTYPEEGGVSFRDVINSDYSPGRILRMSEHEVSARLADLAMWQPNKFQVVDSMNLRQIRRAKTEVGPEELIPAYRQPRFISI